MAKKNSDDISKESLKAVEEFIRKTEQAKKNVGDINNAFGNIATQLFGISGAAFFKEVPKTTEEIIKQKEQLSKLSQDISTAYEQIGDTIKTKFSDIEKSLKDMSYVMSNELVAGFSKVASSMDFQGQINSMEDIVKLEEKFLEARKDSTKNWNDYKDSYEEFQKLKKAFEKEEKKFFDENKEFYDKILAKNEDFLSELNQQERIQALMQIRAKGINGLVEEQSSLLKDIVYHSEGFLDSEKEAVRTTETLSGKFEEVSQEATKATNSVFSMGEAIGQITKNFASGIIPSMLETNQIVKDTQKDFGLMFGKEGLSYKDMAMLTSESAKFGMSTKDTLQMMGELGEELRTTDTKYLASATEHFLAIQKATGISSEEVTTIAGEMMRAGQSAGEVEDYMQGANKMAKLFGVNSKKVLQGVARNMEKMRQMGFKGGEESLTRVVATAERLRMNVDEIFDVAQRARSIEGAMEMASELQLAGGSFANINPMDLLSAARKGPDELQKILTQMGGDIGSWNKETGKFQFDPVDVDRLQMVADATGQSLDSIQKMIQKNAEDARKEQFMPDLQMGEIMGPDGKPLDQGMMTNMLKDSLDVDGEIIKGSLLDKAGIKDIKDLTNEQAKSIMEEYANDQKSLEEQAKNNQSFQDAITAFKDSVMNLFTVFQPILEIFTSFVQTLNEFSPVGKMLGAAIIGFIAFSPKIVAAADAMKSAFGGIKDMFGKGKDFVNKLRGKDISKEALPGADSKDKAPGGSGGGLKSLADGLAAMGGKGVLKGIANTALAAPALLLMLPAMPTLLFMAGIGALGKLVEFGFQSVARGVSAMGEAKGLLKGALAMVIVGAALIPFAFALQMMAEVEWGTIGMMVVGIIALAGITALLGFIAPLMLAGAVALAAASVGLLIFGAAIMVFATASQMMQGMSFDWLGSLGWNLLIAAPGLLLGGLALLAAAPALMIGAMAMIPMMGVLEKASSIDWNSFGAMSSALYTISGAILAFGAATMAGGLMSAIGGLLGGGGPLSMLETLATLAIEAAAPLMMMSEAINSLSDGLEKLSAASASLDMEKLDMLRELAWSMAIGAVGGGIMGDSIDKIAEALMKLTKSGEGGGGGGGTKKIEINLKLNGRDIQRVIVDDTSIVS